MRYGVRATSYIICRNGYAHKDSIKGSPSRKEVLSWDTNFPDGPLGNFVPQDAKKKCSY